MERQNYPFPNSIEKAGPIEIKEVKIEGRLPREIYNKLIN